MNSDFCLAKSTAWRLSASTPASLTGQLWLNFNSMCQKHHLGRLKSYEHCFCCHPNSWGYVSTANLDGETNLKLKTAPQLTQGALTTGALMLGGDGVYDSQHFLGKVSHSVLVMNYPPLGMLVVITKKLGDFQELRLMEDILHPPGMYKTL